MLELVRHQPDWLAALGVALTRPPGVPERRREEDPWNPDAGRARERNAEGREPVGLMSDELEHGLGLSAQVQDETGW